MKKLMAMGQPRKHPSARSITPDGVTRKPTAEITKESRPKRYLKTAGIVLVVTIIVVVCYKFVPVKAYLRHVKAWVEAHHVGGIIVLPILIWIALPLWIPCSLLEIIAGSLVGMAEGILLGMFGKMAGALTAFMIGRQLGKKRIGEYLMAKVPAFRALCDVLQSCDWKPLLLLQLSGLPNAVKCYGLSITSVSLWRFTVSSLVGNLPYSIVWTYIGRQTAVILASASTSSGSSTASAAHISTPQLVILIVGLVVTFLALATLSFYARKHLQLQARVGSFSTAITTVIKVKSPVMQRQSVTAIESSASVAEDSAMDDPAVAEATQPPPS